MLKLKVGARVMLTVNSDIQDCLINDQTGNDCHNKFAQVSVWKAYGKFSDEQAGLKKMRSCFLGRKIIEFLLRNVELRFQERKDQHLRPLSAHNFL